MKHGAGNRWETKIEKCSGGSGGSIGRERQRQRERERQGHAPAERGRDAATAFSFPEMYVLEK